jgi:putative endonuclease
VLPNESYLYIQTAIAREKEIKKWSRLKKEALIALKNPDWHFLNKEICGAWPPSKEFYRY